MLSSYVRQESYVIAGVYLCIDLDLFICWFVVGRITPKVKADLAKS